jgi:hypothetical protein
MNQHQFLQNAGVLSAPLLGGSRLWGENGYTTVPGNGGDRSELWACLSTDEGHTWSEPRFVIAHSAGGGKMGQFADSSVSYVDLIADRGMLHPIISHQFRQVLAVRFEEHLLRRFPTKAELHRLTGG